MKANLTTQVGREGWNVEGKEQRLATLLDWLQLGVVCIVLGLCFRREGITASGWPSLSSCP